MVKHIPRLFYPNDIIVNDIIALDSKHSHYISSVMRLSDGDDFHIFNGHDGEFIGQCCKGNKKQVHVKIIKKIRDREILTPLALAFSFIQTKQLQWLITKAIELGVTYLQPVHVQQAQKKFTDISHEKIESWACDAIAQCGRLAMPIIKPAIDFTALINYNNDYQLFIACEDDTIKQRSYIHDIFTNAYSKPPMMMIGPAGGFHRDELYIMQQWTHNHQAILLSLGKHILRSETAAIATLSCWQAIAGDWSV